MASLIYSTSASASTGDAWNQWAVVDTDTTTASDGTVWGVWASTSTTANTTTDRTVWYAWNDGTYVQARTSYQPVQESEEQKQARIAREAERAREAEERRKQEAEALQRAEELLMTNLDEKQKQDWITKKAFEVLSQSGKLYRIRNQNSMNVDEFDPRGKHVASHCIVPRERVPLPDQLVMQKLMLEHHEADFMQIANHRAN